MALWDALRARFRRAGSGAAATRDRTAREALEASREAYAAVEALRDAMLAAEASSWPGAIPAWDRLRVALDRLEGHLRTATSLGGGEPVLEDLLRFVDEFRRAADAATAEEGDALADHWAAGTAAWNDAQDEARRIVRA